MSKIRAVDVGFGAIKAVSAARRVDFPAVVADYRPLRYTSGLGEDKLQQLAYDYQGYRYFMGDIVYKQSTAQVRMSADRYTRPEGMTLLLAGLALLAESNFEQINLVTGLPVAEYKERKDDYINALKGFHRIQGLQLDGRPGELYTVEITDVKVLPQPMGTVFNSVLDLEGDLPHQADPRYRLAAGNLAVLDIGHNTVDLVRCDKLQFIDAESDSFNDLGMFESYKQLARLVKAHYPDINIQPAQMDYYLRNGGAGKVGIDDLKAQIFRGHAGAVASRALNTWRSTWQLDRIIVTGGGAAALGSYITHELGQKAFLENDAKYSNCTGYYKFGQRTWR